MALHRPASGRPIDSRVGAREIAGMIETALPCSHARRIISRYGLMRRLARFSPRWVGSIPLDVHGPGADIDIACSAAGGLAAFRTALEMLASGFPGGRVDDNLHAGEASVIARLVVEQVPVEIFGRARPVETHESYVHWLAEHRLLQLAEDRLRTDVRAAKADGLKTEPAFAHCLKLGGDPFVELLKLASPGDDALRSLIRSAGYRTR